MKNLWFPIVFFVYFSCIGLDPMVVEQSAHDQVKLFAEQLYSLTSRMATCDPEAPVEALVIRLKNNPEVQNIIVQAETTGIKKWVILSEAHHIAQETEGDDAATTKTLVSARNHDWRYWFETYKSYIIATGTGLALTLIAYYAKNRLWPMKLSGTQTKKTQILNNGSAETQQPQGQPQHPGWTPPPTDAPPALPTPSTQQPNTGRPLPQIPVRTSNTTGTQVQKQASTELTPEELAGRDSNLNKVKVNTQKNLAVTQPQKPSLKDSPLLNREPERAENNPNTVGEGATEDEWNDSTENVDLDQLERTDDLLTLFTEGPQSTSTQPSPPLTHLNTAVQQDQQSPLSQAEVQQFQATLAQRNLSLADSYIRDANKERELWDSVTEV